MWVVHLGICSSDCIMLPEDSATSYAAHVCSKQNRRTRGFIVFQKAVEFFMDDTQE